MIRNKKTGQVGELRAQLSSPVGSIKYFVVVCGTISYNYDSLDELNDEWESYEEWGGYEEPKEDYKKVIDTIVRYVEESSSYWDCDESVKKFVEKLKAYKRLKDKGFKIEGIKEDWQDLDLLFGGDDE